MRLFEGLRCSQMHSAVRKRTAGDEIEYVILCPAFYLLFHSFWERHREPPLASYYAVATQIVPEIRSKVLLKLLPTRPSLR